MVRPARTRHSGCVTSGMRTLPIRNGCLAGPAPWVVAALAFVAAAAAAAEAPRMQNLTQLIADSDSIIAGKVERVTDGVDENGMPFTEVTIAVSASAKGGAPRGSNYTFRQFGQARAAAAADGAELAAEGFPQWVAGERVLAFLCPPAARTRFQTTTGLAQGKLRLKNGRAQNEFGNQGLFEGVRIQDGLLTAREQAMVDSRGAVDSVAFIGLVSRAVEERWIESGAMR